MPREDKMLKCVQCEKEFPFSASEQEFYAKKNYSDPKRCKDCRQQRPAQKESTVPAEAELQETEELIHDVVKAMGIKATVHHKVERGVVHWMFNPADSAQKGMLIGKTGKTINALETIIYCMGRAVKASFVVDEVE